MASTIGVLYVDPRGESVDVSITSNGTTPVAAYTARHGDTLHTFPQTITEETAYFFARPTTAFVSCKRSDTELAPDLVPEQVHISHGKGVKITPIGNPQDEALIEAVALSDSGLDDDIQLAGVDGRLYFATDSGIIYRDNGLAWVAFPAADMDILAHELDTTDVHGIDDTADVIVRVFHDADANFPRPSAPATVIWIGSVVPNNAEATDLRVDTA